MIMTSMHVGDTRSGKKILAYDELDELDIMNAISDFHERDFFDAYCVFQYMVVYTRKRYGADSISVRQFGFLTFLCEKNITKDFLSAEKVSLSLVTSIDLTKFGKSLTKKIFHD